MKRILCALLVLLTLAVLPVLSMADEGTLVWHEEFDEIGKMGSALQIARNTCFEHLFFKTGALNDFSGDIKIRKNNDSLALYAEGVSNTSAYVRLLSAAQVGAFCEENFTLQYDISYLKGTGSDGYTGFAINYHGDEYTLIALDMGGKLSVIGCDNGLETLKASYAKLTGVPYDGSTQAMKGVTRTVRVQVDYENGITVWVKGDGDFEQVIHTAAARLDPDDSGALALVTKGTQAAYIDNISLWTGLGECPEGECLLDTVSSDPAVCSGHHWDEATCDSPVACRYCGETQGEALGHVYADDTAACLCDRCGISRDANENDWTLYSLPAYEGGVKSQRMYNDGQGINALQPVNRDMPMALIAETTAEEFAAYTAKMADWGYTQTFENAIDGNRYAAFEKDGQLAYAYYTDYDGSARVLEDTVSVSGPAEFGYTYEKQPGDKTVLYQIGVPMSENGTGIGTNGKRLDCGMMYMIHLADNSLLLIDGGGYQEFDDAEIEGVMNLMEEITGVQDGERIRIACWYITHGHNDHYSGLCRLFSRYSNRFTLERVMWNFPSINMRDSFSSAKSNLNKLYGYIPLWFGKDVDVLKLQTGMKVQIADVTVETIYTHADYVNLTTGYTKELNDDYNNSSLVSVFTFDGFRFFQPGDINTPVQKVLLDTYSDESLKCDVLQVAHHVINDMGKLYDKVQAEIALVPQSPKGARRYNNRVATMETVEKYAQAVHYASEETVGYAVSEDGTKLVQVYEGPVWGGDYGGWKW